MAKENNTPTSEGKESHSATELNNCIAELNDRIAELKEVNTKLERLKKDLKTIMGNRFLFRMIFSGPLFRARLATAIWLGISAGLVFCFFNYGDSFKLDTPLGWLRASSIYVLFFFSLYAAYRGMELTRAFRRKDLLAIQESKERILIAVVEGQGANVEDKIKGIIEDTIGKLKENLQNSIKERVNSTKAEIDDHESLFPTEIWNQKKEQVQNLITDLKIPNPEELQPVIAEKLNSLVQSLSRSEFLAMADGSLKLEFNDEQFRELLAQKLAQKIDIDSNKIIQNTEAQLEKKIADIVGQEVMNKVATDISKFNWEETAKKDLMKVVSGEIRRLAREIQLEEFIRKETVLHLADLVEHSIDRGKEDAASKSGDDDGEDERKGEEPTESEA